jgi:hypothetical protein
MGGPSERRGCPMRPSNTKWEGQSRSDGTGGDPPQVTLKYKMGGSGVDPGKGAIVNLITMGSLESDRRGPPPSRRPSNTNGRVSLLTIEGRHRQRWTHVIVRTLNDNRGSILSCPEGSIRGTLHRWPHWNVCSATGHVHRPGQRWPF